MSRSLKKGPFVAASLTKKLDNAKDGDVIKTRSRSSTITPNFIGKKIAIHNGRKFIEIFITEEMVGHKLGEFSFTTTFKNHGGKKAK